MNSQGRNLACSPFYALVLLVASAALVCIATYHRYRKDRSAVEADRTADLPIHQPTAFQPRSASRQRNALTSQSPHVLRARRCHHPVSPCVIAASAHDSSWPIASDRPRKLSDHFDRSTAVELNPGHTPLLEVRPPYSRHQSAGRSRS